MAPRGVSILGSTGSIGCNTLRVIQSFGAERFRVVALGAGGNFEKLSEQIERFRPELVSVNSEDTVENSGTSCELEEFQHPQSAQVQKDSSQ
jgi:1-deoxy-D-xylulose-5-phosphate reductoisomerase